MLDWIIWHNGTLTLNIPIAEPFQFAAWAVVVSLPLIFILAIINLRPTLIELLQSISKKLPQGQAQRTVGWFSILFSPFWMILFVITFGILLRVVWNFPNIFFSTPKDITPSTGSSLMDLRWYTLGLVALLTALGGLIAVPLSILRNFAIERQTKTAEENLTTSLINTAIQGLGAEKTVSRIGRPVKIDDYTEIQWRGDDFPNAGPTRAENWQTFETTEPNLAVRIGAIYTLERIADDTPEHYIRILDILCSYIRENSPAKTARKHKCGTWPKWPEAGATELTFIQRDQKIDSRRSDLQKWKSEEIPSLRMDIQTALTVLGRRVTPDTAILEKQFQTASEKKYLLDLRDTNLQKADLTELNFEHALFTGSNLDGAILVKSKLNNADLQTCSMIHADLSEAKMRRTELQGACLEGATLFETEMQHTNLNYATLQQANMLGVQLEGASLINNANMEDANLQFARLQDARLNNTQLQFADLREAQLMRAEFQNADLTGATIASTNAKYSSWRLAKLPSIAKWADLRGAKCIDPAQLQNVIGNEHTLLPAKTDYIYDTLTKTVPCWNELPPYSKKVARVQIRPVVEEEPAKECERKFLCSSKETPRPVGIFLNDNHDHPDGHPLRRRFIEPQDPDHEFYEPQNTPLEGYRRQY